MSGGSAAAAAPRTGGARAIAIDIVLNVAVPYVAYVVLKRAGQSDTRALILTAVVPALVALASLVYRRRINGLSLLVIFATLLSCAGSWHAAQGEKECATNKKGNPAMSTTTTHSPYLPVRDEWLARRSEEILEPALPIVDPHHHLWERPDWLYMLDDLLADTNSGHNIVATVFVQCRSMHRASGPEAFQPVGETEFVNGVAAMSASGGYGPAKICAGIVGHVDLRNGERSRDVLEAHIRAGGGRFRGSGISPRTMRIPVC